MMALLADSFDFQVGKTALYSCIVGGTHKTRLDLSGIPCAVYDCSPSSISE